MKRISGFSTDSVNKMAFFNIMGPVILNGINFFTIPIFTRMLGTDNYGLFTIYSTWVNVLTIIISLQVQGTLGVANIQLEKSEKAGYTSSILSLSIISFGIIFILTLVFMPWVSDFVGLPSAIVILMLLQALGMAFVNFATTKFTYDKLAHKTFLISILVAFGGIGLSLLFLYRIQSQEELYLGRTYGVAIPYILLGFLLAFYFFAKGKTVFSKKYWSFCLPLCLPLIFHGLSHLVLGQADRVMLQKMTTESIVGIYGFTATFANIMNIIYNAFNTTWVPFYYDDMKAGNLKRIKERTKNYVFVFSIISVGFMLLAPEVVKMFASRDFWSGTKLVPILVMGNYMMFLYSFPVNFEFYHRKTALIAVGTGCAAILNCILNFFWIPVGGMTGAGAATLVSYCALWVFHHCVARYVMKEEYNYRLKPFILPLILTSCGCLAAVLLNDFMLIRWAIGIVLGILLLKRIIRQKSLF